MRKVQELIAAVTRDDAALHNLRFDPAALARSMDLARINFRPWTAPGGSST